VRNIVRLCWQQAGRFDPMKRLLKNVGLLSMLLFSIITYAQAKTAYYCFPCNSDCDKTAYTSKGKCTHCGMDLIEQSVADHDKATNAKRLQVLFYLQDGVEVLDFAGPMEVFSYAGFEVKVVSKTKSPIKSQGVLTIIPEYSIEDAPQADILAFFGGNSGVASNDSSVITWVKDQTRPAYYFSVCTGAFILAKAGFLDNLTATTFHNSIAELRVKYPKIKVLDNVRFVDNGRVITTAGISAGIDGALHLVEKISGREAARDVARYMEYDKWVPDQGLVVK
jgi:putative intracellular protease/amidase/DNA-directed RNA polymerase subunit RPC12/RpoP